MGQVDQGTYVDLHHGLISCQITFMEFFMTAKTSIINKDIDFYRPASSVTANIFSAESG